MRANGQQQIKKCSSFQKQNENSHEIWYEKLKQQKIFTENTTNPNELIGFSVSMEQEQGLNERMS